MENECNTVRSQPDRSSGQTRAAKKYAKSAIIGTVAAALLYTILTSTTRLVDESSASEAVFVNAQAIMMVATNQMGAKRSCGIEGIAGYEREVQTLANFYEFKSEFNWQSPFIVELKLSRNSTSIFSNESSITIDANHIDVTPLSGGQEQLMARQQICNELRQ